jgi:hypothetical protein
MISIGYFRPTCPGMPSSGYLQILVIIGELFDTRLIQK